MIGLSLLVFLNQLIFIGLRTVNVKAISNNELWKTVLTGIIIHLSWLFGISIGADAGIKLIAGQFEYLPVVIASTLGGVVGTIIALKQKK